MGGGGGRGKILAGATITRVALAIPGRAARGKLLVTAEFSLRPIAVARRPRAVRPIAARTIAVFSKTFATRRVGPLVAELLFAKACGRTRIVAVAARRTVVAVEVRAVAARRVRALVGATILARFERTLFTVATARWTAGKRPIAARRVI